MEKFLSLNVPWSNIFCFILFKINFLRFLIAFSKKIIYFLLSILISRISLYLLINCLNNQQVNYFSIIEIVDCLIFLYNLFMSSLFRFPHFLVSCFRSVFSLIHLLLTSIPKPFIVWLNFSSWSFSKIWVIYPHIHLVLVQS